MKNCTHYLITLGHLESALLTLERTQFGSNREMLIQAIEANIALVAKEYEACKK